MLFSSITFLYFFLPATIFLYFASPQKGRNLVLLVMSLLFYAWGEPVYVLLMALRSQFPTCFCGWRTDPGEEGQPGYFIFCLFFCRLRHCFILNISTFL